MNNGMVRQRSGFAHHPWFGALRAKRLLVAPLTLCAVALQLTGCGGEQPPLSVVATIASSPSPTVAVRQAASPPAATPIPLTPGIGPVQWTTGEDALTGAPVDSAELFFTDSPQVIASVKADLLAVGTTVEAAWFYNNTSLDAFTTTLTIDHPAPERWLSFRLERTPDTFWPAGEYEIHLKVNGEDAQQATIFVEQRS